jgi:hypothetical protein
MTGQPTVYIGIFFSMAFNTFPHAPDFSGQTLQILHLAVAFLAGDFAIDVALVVKQHVLGHVIDFHPRCRCFCVEIAVFFFYPGVVGDDVIMTVQAFSHRRHSGEIGICHVRVTILALNLFDTAVDMVTVWDGLLWSHVCVRISVENIYKGTDKDSTEKCDQYCGCVSFQGFFLTPIRS